MIRSRRLRPVFAAATLVLASTLCASPGFSGIASPANSVVDSFLVFCPAGDIVFHVMARDLANNPEADHEGDLELCGCTGVPLCPLLATDPYTIVGGCRVRIFNDPEPGS